MLIAVYAFEKITEYRAYQEMNDFLSDSDATLQKELDRQYALTNRILNTNKSSSDINITQVLRDPTTYCWVETPKNKCHCMSLKNYGVYEIPDKYCREDAKKDLQNPPKRN